MLSNFVVLANVVIAIWLVTLTLFFWKTLSRYNKMADGGADKGFKSMADSLIKDVASSKKDIDQLKTYSEKLHKEGQLHIQKVGLLRFNPFKDTGGDQSFILSLSDANDTGVIISGLYSRSGTRWYTKRIVNGKGVEHELSEEEKKVLKETRLKYE
ncbi:MAG: hypothetical protein ACD_50C00207G0008 [uncultured bacterium]|nr:MAG: hypothetical protein ACD_50C00207G0008 [uncultured bacterium]OGH13107.1 MAG: hypothetical protein A2687_00405 [Candidatus Levybacteria bacterium RIFCSPHIGHO2_01_FULL_38_26]